MSDSSLWSFFLAAALSVTVAVVALTAALVISQRNRLQMQRRYSQRLLQAQDDERAWVAREVHDDALQQLAAARSSFDQIGHGVSASDVERQLGMLATTLRNVAHRLHPALLHNSGIALALTQLATEASANLGLEVSGEVGSPSAEPAAAVGLAFYRVAQEALRNVQQHAGVNRAVMTFAEDSGRWTLTVADHGRGTAAERSRDADSLGLISMRERAALVGGRIRIESTPGAGTTVTFSVPRGTA